MFLHRVSLDLVIDSTMMMHSSTPNIDANISKTDKIITTATSKLTFI